MGMTTGEELTAGLSYYLNQGSSVVTEDRDQRQKAHFLYTKAAKRLWLSAPYYYRKGNDDVQLTAGVGDMPSDFQALGTQGQIYIDGQLYRPLRYKRPDWIQFKLTNVPQAGTPWAYTLYATGAKAALGVQQILCWPTDNSKLNVKVYDKLMPEMVDHPLAAVAGIGSAGALTGTYTYQITFVTARGETEGGTISAPVTVASQDVDLTDIPLWWGRTVTSRKIYRIADGATQHKLVDTISDNTTTAYTDSTVDGALGDDVPTAGTAVSGTEIFPPEFHESALWDGLVYLLAKNQGDNRDIRFSAEWDRQVQRMWEEIQQGQNEVHAFPAFPGPSGGSSVWDRWSPPQ